MSKVGHQLRQKPEVASHASPRGRGGPLPSASRARNYNCTKGRCLGEAGRAWEKHGCLEAMGSARGKASTSSTGSDPSMTTCCKSPCSLPESPGCSSQAMNFPCSNVGKHLLQPKFHSLTKHIKPETAFATTRHLSIR